MRDRQGAQWAELHMIVLAVEHALDKHFPEVRIFTDFWFLADYLVRTLSKSWLENTSQDV